MNRLLTRKKTRDGADEEYASTAFAGQVPNQSPAKKKTGWRKKKGKLEPEPEVNIRAALPTAEEFRTSLIMPNLSTRFSMLKEQDDPNSKIGKASDDSVLNPRRLSRLGDSGVYASGLSDIAEVSSLTSSTQTRLGAIPQRNGSYTYGDGYATDDDSSHNGSIMSRARPGEGNMLFGGRQKIYRIPVGDSGAVQTLGSSERRGMRGRALYEDDVSMSAFQRLREEEKERLRLEKDMEMYYLGKDDPNSPSLSNSEKRETSSSTNSGRSMIGGSTAPTSVGASSPSLPSMNAAQANYPPAAERAKSRKLYEQGLEQHIQEQQSAALGRISSVKRNPSSSGNTPIKARSASNMHERFEAAAQSSGRITNPTPAFQAPVAPIPSMRRPSLEQSNAQPRTSSQEDAETEKRNALWEAMDPIDRGMATAMGTFNRPKQFDEQQFLQRQMSLLKQQPGSRPENESSKAAPSSGSAYQRHGDGTRPRGGTNGTDKSWSEKGSKGENIPPQAPSRSAKRMIETYENRDPRMQAGSTKGTFLVSPEPGEEIIQNPYVDSRIRQPAQRAPPKETGNTKRRPAPAPIELNRTHQTSESSESSTASPRRNKEKRRGWSPDELQSGLAAARGPHKEFISLQDNAADDTNVAAEPEPSSSEENRNIQGLVQEHLRQQSNSSSIYPAPTPGLESTTFHTHSPSGYDMRNPWEADETAQQDRNDLNESFGMETDPEYDAPTSFPDSGNGHLQGLGVHEAEENVLDWEQELNKQHARGESTETAHERQAFATELAQRQRTIQENLRVKGGHNSPSPPPANAKNAFESSLKNFGMLRGKQNNDAVPADRDVGYGANATADPSYSKNRGNREGGLSPPTLGRTLHSRLPRDDYEGVGDYYMERSRGPRPSVEAPRPSLETDTMTQGHRPPPQSSRAPPPRKLMSENPRPLPKPRSNSEAASPTRRAKNMNGAVPPRPSIENIRIRSDSHPSKPLVQENRMQENRERSERPPLNNPPQPSINHTELTPAEPKASTDYSETTTPPLTADSTSNIASSATSASMSSTAPLITLQSDQEAPAATLYVPPPSAATASSSMPPPPAPPSRTKTEPLGTGVTRGPSLARPTRKNTISKRDISEPKLINYTSAVSTMELPEGASLQNGLRDDFDVVLMGSSSNAAAAPSPTIPTGDKPRKPGFLRQFSRKEKVHPEVVVQAPDDEPEPRRFAIRRTEPEEGKAGGKATHLAALQPDPRLSVMSSASYGEYGAGIL